MSISREIVQGRQTQGENEKIAYKLTTTPWGGTPTSPVVIVRDVADNFADVTSSVMIGSPSISGDVIMLPVLQSLVIGKVYRITIRFVTAGNTEEAFAIVVGER